MAVDTFGRSGTMVKHVTIHSNDRLAPATSVTVMLSVGTVTAGPK